MRNKLFQKIIDNAPKEREIFVEKYTDLILRIKEVLKEQALSQKDFAERMDKKPSEVSRWLSGKQNLTLRSIAKMEAELGVTLIEIPKPKVKSSNTDWEAYEVTFKVQVRKPKINFEDYKEVSFEKLELMTA